jgi:hypothetical protein
METTSEQIIPGRVEIACRQVLHFQSFSAPNPGLGWVGFAICSPVGKEALINHSRSIKRLT